MGEKYIKKIVNLTVISEEWQSNTISDSGLTSFTVHGEVKNTGLSEIKNAIVVAAIINKKSNNTFQLLTKKLAIYKAADYTILPPIKPGDSLPFEITITFPPSRTLLTGSLGIRTLENKILNDIISQKVFLIYDTNVLDNETQEWFKDELLEKIKLIRPQWKAVHNKQKALKEFNCTGQIKNIGNKEIKNFYVHGILESSYGETITLTSDENEYNIHGNQLFEQIASNGRAEFDFSCRLPSMKILEDNNLTPALIEKRVASGQYKTRIFIQYADSVRSKLTYRDVDEAPSVIEEEFGEKKIEILEEDWSQEDDEYLITGIIKNSGTRDVENVYIITSIFEKNSEEPIMWETATDTHKTLTIEKISYLKIDEEYPYSFRLKIPSSKLFGKTKWNSKNIAQGIEEEELAQKVDLYYTKEDVQEEGIKRLRFGNSYYQLNNFRGCLREFQEGLKLVPDEKRFYLNMGVCQYKLGEYQRTIENCKKALSIEPDYAKSLYLLGLVYHTMKKYDEALSWYQKAFKSENDNPKILYNISCIYFALNKVDDGIKQLRRAFTFDKNMVLSQMVRDPELNNMKNHPQFSAFLKDIRIEAMSSS